MKAFNCERVVDVYASLAAQMAANADEQDEPLYRQISSLMERFIEEGRFCPGERLPPERKLMDIFGVSRSTLRVALAELADRQYLSTTQGRGTFVLRPQKKRLLRILAIERFRADYWSVAPLHYDWIREAGEAAGVRIHYHYAPTIEEVREELIAPPSGYDAIVLFRLIPEWSEVFEKMPDSIFENSTVPIMIIDRPIQKRGLNTVSWDFRKAARLATQQLIDAGHKRVGFIGGAPVPGHSFSAFYEGYLEAMRDAGLPVPCEDQLLIDTPLFVGGVVPQEVHARVANFFDSRKFTAVVPCLVSSPVEHAILKKGIHIPKELSVVMVSEDHVMSRSVFRWSSILEPSTEIIKQGIARLAAVCRGQQAPGFFELFPPTAHKGATILSPGSDDVSGCRLLAGRTDIQ